MDPNLGLPFYKRAFDLERPGLELLAQMGLIIVERTRAPCPGPGLDPGRTQCLSDSAGADSEQTRDSNLKSESRVSTVKLPDPPPAVALTGRPSWASGLGPGDAGRTERDLSQWNQRTRFMCLRQLCLTTLIMLPAAPTALQ